MGRAGRWLDDRRARWSGWWRDVREGWGSRRSGVGGGLGSVGLGLPSTDLSPVKQRIREAREAANENWEREWQPWFSTAPKGAMITLGVLCALGLIGAVSVWLWVWKPGAPTADAGSERAMERLADQMRTGKATSAAASGLGLTPVAPGEAGARGGATPGGKSSGGSKEPARPTSTTSGTGGAFGGR